MVKGISVRAMGIGMGVRVGVIPIRLKIIPLHAKPTVL